MRERPERPEPSVAGSSRTEVALAFDRVTAGYGSAPAVTDVSLEARRGEITGLIGPNGSGKTTLIRVASRALKPWSGSVRVCGVDPYAIGARQAARLVAVVPQETAPAFDYSVLEMILMGRSPYRSPWGGGSADDWVRVRRAAEAADVQHLSDRGFGELSGGERQRVVLAQALAQDSPVLLLDEPTTHLDIRHVVDMLGLVRHLAKDQGVAVVAIFHDLNLAAAYCDVVYAMEGGRLRAAGTPGDVITATLLREVFGVEAAVSPVAAAGRPSITVAAPPAVDTRRGGRRVHVIGGAGRSAHVLRALVERGFHVTAGVLHDGDTDATVAEALNLERVTVPAFGVIDEPSAADCRALVASGDAVIVADPPFGPGNVENLRIAAAAPPTMPLVVIEQIPIAERDFTGGIATDLWTELRPRATVVASPEAAVEAVASLVGERSPR